MKKFFNKFLTFGLSIAMLFGLVTVNLPAAEPTVAVEAAAASADSYYSGITATSGDELLGQVHDLIVRTHGLYTNYDACKNMTYIKKTDPSLDGKGILEFYTHETMTTGFGSSAGILNREHVWPQSLGNWSTSNAGSDLHHIRPTETRLNGNRGNKKYGEVTGGTPQYSKTTSGANSQLGGYANSSTFMPLDNVKGDVARIIMYVYTHYNTTSNVHGTVDSRGSGALTFTRVMAASNEDAAKQLLLKWNESDPVDNIERTRNDAVYEIQGNRNPFIDHPEYAEAIWGDGSIGDPVTPTSLSLTPSTVSMTVGKTQVLTVSAQPSNATKTVTWKSDNAGVASVSNGTVTANGEGTAHITATSTLSSSITASATVTVTKPAAGESNSFTITLDSFDLIDNYNFQNWSSGGVSGIAYIFGGNSSYPASSGMQFSKPTDGRSYYLANTTPVPGAITSITAKSHQYSNDWTVLTSGTSFGKVTGKPTGGTNRGQKQVPQTGATWNIDGNDSYFAITYDTTEYTGYLDSVEVTYTVGGGTETPDPNKLTGLTLSPTALNLVEGKTGTLTVTRIPSTATAEQLEWTTGSSAVATVENGTVTAKGVGNTTIRVASKTDPSVYAEATVTVSADPTKLTKLELTPKTLDLVEGGTGTLTAVRTPSTATDTLKWASDTPLVATVENGQVTAKGIGSATITVESTANPSVKATATVTVKADPNKLTGLTIVPGELSLEAGKSAQLTATRIPTTAVDEAIAWESDTEGVATVDAAGMVAAVAEGTAHITVRSTVNDSVKDTITVTVTKAQVDVPPTPDPLTQLKIIPEALELTLGQTATGELQAQRIPATAVEEEIEWLTDDEGVATVQGGLVTARGVGTAHITVRSKTNPSVSDTITVTVKADPTKLAGLKFSAQSMELTEGQDDVTLSPIPEPATAAVGELEWTSSETGVATVENGKLTVVGPGTTVITVRSKADPSISATITITVKAAEDTGNEAKLAAFHTAVENITEEGTFAERLASIDNAVKLYRSLTQTEKERAAEDVAALQAAIEAYNDAVSAVNADADEASDAAWKGMNFRGEKENA